MNDAGWHQDLEDGLETVRRSVDAAMRDIHIGVRNGFGVQVRRRDSGRDRMDFHFANTDGKALLVEIPDGDIRVSGHEAPEIVVEADSDSGIGASETPEAVRVTKIGNDCDGDCSIRVPFGTPVSVHARNGDVTLDRTWGAVDVTAPDGDIKILGARGSCQAMSRDGDVNVRDVEGDVTASTNDGDLRLDGIGGHLTINILNGDVTVRGSRLTGLQANGEATDMSVETSISRDGRYAIGDVNGDLSLRFPPDSQITFTVADVSGDIGSRLPFNLSEGGEGRYSGTLNGGGATFTVGRVDGDLQIRSGQVAPPAAAPVPPTHPMPPTPPFPPTHAAQSGVDSTELRHDPTLSILDRLRDGELSVEDALKQLDSLG